VWGLGVGVDSCLAGERTGTKEEACVVHVCVFVCASERDRDRERKRACVCFGECERSDSSNT